MGYDSQRQRQQHWLGADGVHSKWAVGTEVVLSVESGWFHYETRPSSSQIFSEVGVRHTFRELYRQSCGCIQLYIDNTLWSYTHFNPFAAWQYPFSPVFKGEVGWLANDMPGSATMKTRFSALGAQDYFGDGLRAMPCTMTGENEYPTRWARETTAGVCDAFNIYTK
jgi:hypothetical protein